MAEHVDKLPELRRLDSADKTRRVLAALDATIDTGQSLTIAALARRAGVSRRFIYDHPELRAEAERRSAQAADRRASRATARVTTASLRADLANAKAANHRLNTELQALRRRLGQILGHEILADLGDAPAEPVDPRIEQLTDALAQTNKELAHRGEELAAARQINRELIARLNREH
jgi:chromosome segregation ATPase